MQELLAIFKDYLQNLPLDDSPKQLYSPIKYSLEGGGKRLRPVFLLMAYNIFSDDISRALPLAASVEVFHNFTLLHDDIMDNAPTRHGRDAVHKAWGANAAILSGDAMMIYAYSLLERVESENFAEIFKQYNKMAMEVCQGQQLDMEFEKRTSVSREQYLEMVKLKTSALIARSLKMGALLGGARAEDAEFLYNFGIDLGIAFQIQDDLLDTFGNAKTFGKPIGGDILEAKKTFTSISAINLCAHLEPNIMLEALHNTSLNAETKIKQVTELYINLGVRHQTEKEIKNYISKANSHLENLSVSSQKVAALALMAEKLLNRNK
ncbi:MAG: polyprenyl synthetase family protein [Rikenellaceae bacterium]